MGCAAACVVSLAVGSAIAAPPATAPPAMAAATVDDSIGARLVACTTCHGKEGRATPEGYFPRIAGKPAGYLYHQLANFRAGRRRNAIMSYLVEHMTDAYLREIAGYFASLDLPYAAPAAIEAAPTLRTRGEALVRDGDRGAGVPACASCHGDRLTGVEPAVPGLLGLPRDYLVAQLGAWRNGQRQALAPDCMAEVVRGFSLTDVAAVADWLAMQPVPADAKPARAPSARLPLRCGSVAAEAAR